jgi:hypothetical protein
MGRIIDDGGHVRSFTSIPDIFLLSLKFVPVYYSYAIIVVHTVVGEKYDCVLIFVF